jgi:hypothetical protein
MGTSTVQQRWICCGSSPLQAVGGWGGDVLGQPHLLSGVAKPLSACSTLASLLLQQMSDLSFGFSVCMTTDACMYQLALLSLPVFIFVSGQAPM